MDARIVHKWGPHVAVEDPKMSFPSSSMPILSSEQQYKPVIKGGRREDRYEMGMKKKLRQGSMTEIIVLLFLSLCSLSISS